MQQPGLHNRHRDRNGEISRKHGNTLVRTLRRIYGTQFAAGEPETEKLQETCCTSLMSRLSVRWCTITSTGNWTAKSRSTHDSPKLRGSRGASVPRPPGWKCERVVR
jgi:hypothetical protein